MPRKKPYEKFLREIKDGQSPYKCAVCGGNAAIFGRSMSLRPGESATIYQFCETEKVRRQWRKVELTIMDANHAQFLKQNKLIPVTKVAEILGITDVYLRQRIRARDIPFWEMGKRQFVAEKDLDVIKLFFSLVRKNNPILKKRRGKNEQFIPGSKSIEEEGTQAEKEPGRLAGSGHGTSKPARPKNS